MNTDVIMMFFLYISFTEFVTSNKTCILRWVVGKKKNALLSNEDCPGECWVTFKDSKCGGPFVEPLLSSLDGTLPGPHSTSVVLPHQMALT